MESWNSRECEKESPSLENIAHLQTIKRDGESVEDFEDITRDEPSMKDLTAQFLQFETGGRNKSVKGEFVLQNDLLDCEPKSNDYVNVKSSNEILNVVSSEPTVHISDPKDNLDDLYSLEETNQQTESEDLKLQEKPISNILDENKLIDVSSNDEISADKDLLSLSSKKRDSSVLDSESEKDVFNIPSTECKTSKMAEEVFNTQPLSQYTSESGTVKEQESQVLPGDGLHVMQTTEGDMSENDDEIIPEPIPKDYPEIGAIEGKEFLAAIGLDAWFHPELLHPKVESLIYWRDTKKSAVVFSSVLLILFFLQYFSVISVLAYTSLIALFAALAFRIYKSVMQAVQKTSEGHPFKKYLVAVLNHPIITAVFSSIEEYLEIDLTLSPEKAREISEVVVSYVNKGLAECRRLFLIEDVIDSIKFGIVLWWFTYIGSWFTGLSLITLAFAALFTLPKVYEDNKTQIDANVDVVKAKINEVTEKITAVIPLGKKTEDVKDKAE